MTGIEFIIIYALAGVFAGLFVLYRSIGRANELLICNSKAAIKFADAIDEMCGAMSAQCDGFAEIAKGLHKMAEQQEKEFTSIKHNCRCLAYFRIATTPA